MNKIYYFFRVVLGSLFLAVPTLQADQITIHNMSSAPFFIATYYYQDIPFFHSIEKVGPITFVPPQATSQVERPSIKFGFLTKLIFSTSKGDLLPTLSKDQFNRLSSEWIDVPFFKDYFIFSDHGILKGYNSLALSQRAGDEASHALLEKVRTSVANPLLEKISGQLANRRYGTTVAQARIGATLPEQEKNAVVKRLQTVVPNLERLTGMKLNLATAPVIAFCGSGGGFRAMIATLGQLLGLEAIGVLNCLTYIVGLSGSSWLIAPWIATGYSLSEYKQRLLPKLQTNITDFSLNKPEFLVPLLQKTLFNQSLSAVDVWGILIGNKLLSDLGTQAQIERLSNLVPKILSGAYPIPIFTFVEEGPPYSWLEVTPFEVGSTYMNTFIPTWSFGRKFINGTSVDFAPEPSLAFFLGLFGSAFAFTLQEAIKEKAKDIQPAELANFIQSFFTETKLGEQRISPSPFYNFSYGLSASPLRNKGELRGLDAGLAGNIPVPPLLRDVRTVDILIICDASYYIDGAPELKKAETYARDNNLPFPKIDYTNIEKKTISIFKDDTDKTIPVVIYLPRVKNDAYSTTFDPTQNINAGGHLDTYNFIYTPAQINELSGLTEFNVKQNAQLIIDTIKSVAQRNMFACNKIQLPAPQKEQLALKGTRSVYAKKPASCKQIIAAALPTKKHIAFNALKEKNKSTKTSKRERAA